MKKTRNTAIFYYLAAALCYVAAINFFCDGNSGSGVIWLCLGSTDLCLGAVWMNRAKKEEEKDEDEDKDS